MSEIYKPRPYQVFATQKIIDNKAIALMLDMGMGKTVSTLTAINELKFDYWQIDKVLVIAPLRVAKMTWGDEVKQWRHLQNLKVSVVCGDLKQRKKALSAKADIYTINRENVPWLVSYLGRKWDFDMVVIDESSSFKNHRSQRFKALRRIRPFINRLVELTGTPAPSGLMDLWSQIYLLDGGKRLGRTITQYRQMYFYPGQSSGHIVFNYEPKENAKQEIYKKIADICVSLKSEDYLNLPDVIYNKVYVRLPDKILQQYREFEKELVLDMTDSTITASSAAVLTGKLLQFASGAVYDEDRQAINIHDCKLDALEEIRETNEGKNIMVMYWYQHDAVRILDRFPKARILKSVQDLRAWNEGKIKMALLHPASAGHGLNLQRGGNIIVWFSITWNLELYQQANKRLHRPGQKNKVVIHHLIAKNTEDERVMQALTDKAGGQNAMLEAVKAKILKYRKEAEK